MPEVPISDNDSKPPTSLENNQAETIFNNLRQNLKETITLARKTRHYKNIASPQGVIDSYGSFCQSIPVLGSADFTPPLDFVVGDPTPLYHEVSGGSTGKTLKEIYYPPEGIRSTIEPSILNVLNSAANPTLLHKDCETTSYHVTEETLKQQAPKVKTTTYLPPAEIIEKIHENDVVYVVEQVSKLRETMHYFISMAEEKPDELTRGLHGKQFFLELAAEPVHLEEVKEWYDLLLKYTGKTPDIWAIYGTAETLMLGFWHYKPGNKTIKYEVRPNKYVEVLTEDGQPVKNGERGRIIATPLHNEDYQGTVILRYDTGDLGKVEFEEDKMYLSDIGRKPESGMISVWGEKIFVPQIQEIFQALTGRPVSMRVNCGTTRSEQSGEQVVLSFDVYSQDFINNDVAVTCARQLQKILADTYYPLQGLIDDGKLVIKINTGTETPIDLIKAWQIKQL